MTEFHDTCPLTARDVMQREVVTLSPDDTLEDALCTILEHSISGLPVINEENQVVGVISEFALMDLLFDPSIKSAYVSEFMTKEVHTVDEDDPTTKLAHIFALFRIRRLPVLRDGQLVGLVTRGDMLRHFWKSEYVLSDPWQVMAMFDLDDAPGLRR